MNKDDKLAFGMTMFSLAFMLGFIAALLMVAFGAK
jgi:hypothetical protein